jgi:hypothetical protein
MRSNVLSKVFNDEDKLKNVFDDNQGREALIQFIATVETILEKKNDILEKISSCSNKFRIKECPHSNHDQSRADACSLSWKSERLLRSKLKIIDKVLTLLMFHFHRIYEQEPLLTQVHTEDATAMSTNLLCEVNNLALDVCEALSVSIDPHVLKGFATKDIYDVQSSTVSSAGSLLIICDLFADFLHKHTINKSCVDTMCSILYDILQSLKPVHVDYLHKDVKQVLRSRDTAFKAMEDSVAMFSHELALFAISHDIDV